jgi:hypothetical protein
MRTLILTVAFATALAATTLSPGRAEAQVYVYPTVGTSPYIQAGYWSPAYNYSYAWTSPYYTTYSRSWGSPYTGNYNWTWYTPNYYTSYRYGAWPYGWRGRYWRW